MNPYYTPGLHSKAREVSHAKITPQRVIAACAKVWGVSEKLILNRRKTGIAVESRQVAMQIIRKHSDMTLLQVGIIFQKDPGTVFHAVKVVGERMRYADYREKYNEVCRIIETD